jgi:formate dehydrogenase subunit gamma
MIAMVLSAGIRSIVATAMLLFMTAIVPAFAEKFAPDGAPDPTASVTSERALLNQLPRVQGQITIPDMKASVLIQPVGRSWDYFHEVLLHWGGAIVILGTIIMLGVA